MFFFFIIVVLAEVSAGTLPSSTKGNLRVFGGDLDVDRQFRFAVLLQQLQPELRFCTGSLLDANWVITTAHCIDNGKAEDIIVKYGDFTHATTNKMVKVVKLFPYPTFNRAHGINDIALIYVEKILGKSYVKLMAMDYKTLFGLAMSFAGFGSTRQEFIPQEKEDIIKAQVTPIQVAHGVTIPCESSMAFQYSSLCIAPKCTANHQQARSGDSGAPLLYEGKLVGVGRSYDENYALPLTHFTPVSLYMGWIKKTMTYTDPRAEMPISRYAGPSLSQILG